MKTNIRPGFTAEVRDGITRGARCYGSGHRDTATLGTCDGCGWDVAKTKDGRIMPVGNRYGSSAFACWGAQHECDPKQAARVSEMVTGRTRARRDGTTIACPCGQEIRVYHFAWAALVCLGCRGEIEKPAWQVKR